MKISVCMATYNGETYILEQLSSILNELKAPDEVILSDDHSTDRTIELARSLHDDRIKIYFNENEKGYASNFENAIVRSTGEVIFLSDQDDVWVPGKVRFMLEALKHDDLVISDAAIVDGELNLLEKSHFDKFGVRTGFWVNFTKTRYIGACMAFKRVMLKKLLPMPKKRKYCAHDYWIAMVGEAYYKVGLVHIPLLKYRRHGENASSGGVKSGNSLAHKLKVRGYVIYHLLLRFWK